MTEMQLESIFIATFIHRVNTEGTTMEIEIEIIKFNQYVKRTDCRTHWFAFEADTVTHPDFFGVTGNEFKVFVYLLSIATKIKSDKVRLHIPHTASVLNVSQDDILQCFTKLQKKRVISNISDTHVTSTLRPRNGHVTESRLHYITEQNRTEQILDQKQVLTERVKFDFDLIYSKYPKKVGKQKGLKTFKVQIKTQSEYDSLSLATDNYIAHIKNSITDPKYIKQFDTFMNCWRDWADSETGKTNIEMENTSQSLLRKLQERERNQKIL